MSRSKINHVLNLKVAGISALGIAITMLVSAGLRTLLDGTQHPHWKPALALAFIFALSWFTLHFLYLSFTSFRNIPVDEILSEDPADSALLENPLPGFVAMEYFGLIFNRTFLIASAPEGLYGWKVGGPLSAMSPLYFQPFEEISNDPDLMRDQDAIKKLSAVSGGFFIPRSSITSVQANDKRKLGMSGIPHSGRIRIGLADGRTREFILLGFVQPESIQHTISLGHAPALAPSPQQVTLPYVGQAPKKLWIPLILFWTALSGYLLKDLAHTWATSNWPLRLTFLVMLTTPLFLLLEFLVLKITFTETGIRRRTRFGRVDLFPYSSIQTFRLTTDANIIIQFEGGKNLRIYRGQANLEKALAILRAKANVRPTRPSASDT